MEDRDRKAAVLNRLREMLLRQRDKFQSYLLLLENEEKSIRDGDGDRISAQVEMENLIIAEIFSLKKVAEPLRELYRAAYPQAEGTVPPLERTLSRMQEQVAARNIRNRMLLKERMEDLRQEVLRFRRVPTASSPYAAAAVPRLVDITT